MRVFVTGASGWIGSAVVAELIGAGHEVIGLARSDASAAAITSAGATPHRATLDDLDSLRGAAAAADGVIHLAFKHEIAFSGDFQGAADADRRAVETFGEALAGSDRPLVIASGTLGIAPGRVATERDGHGSADAIDGGSRPRPADPAEHRRIRPRPRLARRSLVSGAPGSDQPRRWRSRVRRRAGRHGPHQRRRRLHRRRVQPLAVGAPARFGAPLPPGGRGGPGRIDAARGRGRGRADPRHRRGDRAPSEPARWCRSLPRTRPGTSPGWPASSALDAPASSALTRELMGWQPDQPGLIEDLDQGHYFRTPVRGAVSGDRLVEPHADRTGPAVAPHDRPDHGQGGLARDQRSHPFDELGGDLRAGRRGRSPARRRPRPPPPACIPRRRGRSRADTSGPVPPPR